MNEKMFKIAGVLSDLTRYSIYNYVATEYNGVSVADVANEFSIHPNVARLHLTKLENVELIYSEFDKQNNKSGRPSKRYKVSSEAVSFHLPHRDYSLLTTLALNAIDALGKIGLDEFSNQAYKYGKDFGLASRTQHQISNSSSSKDIAAAIRNTLVTLGLNPHVELVDDEKLVFEVRNCTFIESMKKNPGALCHAHQSLLKGIIDAYFAQSYFKVLNNRHNNDGHKCCNYSVQIIATEYYI
ncbi:helix-turn-helix transcriptional regulator [Desulfuribacillus alkaliarsenatis]|uniref:Transcriptional regulator n=1 Tax=Desulfuribacillus alkaliarsenatis TaxID=766136 RepID=A0A1E5G0P7_9FIRM|nr:transcriptional regulator [Desulfuribacillus alkaliarsenatis]OEF96475.1 hypothetical protein BHF68_07400 [Desulfuribacillus alkaliarsenatis]